MTSEPGPEPGAGPSAAPPTEADPARDAADAARDAADVAPAPAEEHRLHVASFLIEGVEHARAAVFAMIAVVASLGLVRGLGIALLILLVAVLYALVNWRVTRYAVVDGALRLRTGVFARKEQSVPAQRISALDTRRGILQRIFGVVEVQVQTAGGDKKAELRLRAVSFAEAERLRHELGHRARQADARAPAAATATGDAAPAGAGAPATTGGPTFTSPERRLEDDAPVVYAITPRELVVAAVTSPSIAVVFAAMAAVFGFAQDALPDRQQEELTDRLAELATGTALVIAVVFVAVAAVISIVGSILLYGGFRVTRDDGRLRVRRGILTERVGTIQLDRVHGLRVIESPLRQALGYAAIEAEVAGYAGGDEVARTIVPLVRRRELPQLLPRLVPGYRWPQAALQPVPRRAYRRYLVPPLCVAVPLAVALLVAPIGLARVLAVVPVLAAVAWGRLAARVAGVLVDGDLLTLRSRGLSRVTVIALARRMQFSSVSSNPFQRRGHLATFAVRLSSRRGAHVRHLDDEDAHELLATTTPRPSRTAHAARPARSGTAAPA